MSADTVKLYDQLESKIEYLRSVIELQDEKIKKLEDRIKKSEQDNITVKSTLDEHETNILRLLRSEPSMYI